MDYLKAAEEGLKDLRAIPGEDPMERAWRRTLNSVIDQMVEENPSREGAIALMDLKVDPGPFPVMTDLNRRSLAVSVSVGAVLGVFWGGLILPPLPAALSAQWIWTLFALTGSVAGVFFTRAKVIPDMDQARVRLALMAELTCKRIEVTAVEPVRRTDGEIARALYDLKNASPEGLVAAAESLLIDAANRGYEGLGGTPSFVRPSGPSMLRWSSDLLDRYEPFGCYGDGDRVVEERPPVIKDGVVLEKGVVRRADR